MIAAGAICLTRICCELPVGFFFFCSLILAHLNVFLSSPVGRLPSIVTFGCVRACTGAWRAGGVSAVLYWTAVPGHSALLSCMNRYLIHPSLISGPPRSAHFLPCHTRCCCLRCCFTCILSCTSMTTVICGQCQSSCRGVWGADSQKSASKITRENFCFASFQSL